MTTTGIIKEKVIGCKNIDRDNDGIRIAVTRRKVNHNYNNRFQIDESIKELGPTEDLLVRYETGVISHQQFRDEYISQLKDNPASREAFERLCYRVVRQGETITLLCWHLLRVVVLGAISNNYFSIFPI
jgi:uncharacterized protein YeaO (DUF488 family)